MKLLCGHIQMVQRLGDAAFKRLVCSATTNLTSINWLMMIVRSCCTPMVKQIQKFSNSRLTAWFTQAFKQTKEGHTTYTVAIQTSSYINNPTLSDAAGINRNVTSSPLLTIQQQTYTYLKYCMLVFVIALSPYFHLSSCCGLDVHFTSLPIVIGEHPGVFSGTARPYKIAKMCRRSK